MPSPWYGTGLAGFVVFVDVLDVPAVPAANFLDESGRYCLLW